MGTKHRLVLLVLLMALAVAFVAPQGQNCELMDGSWHAVMSCPVAILPAPLVLGLALLSMMTTVSLTPPEKLVLVSIDRPPRRARAR